jgi:hypothetical protein
MEVCGDIGTQYGESGKCLISFSLNSGAETFQHPGDEN